jgi:cell division inhibitor SulA/protein ImuA
MSASLDALLEHPALWRGEACARNAPAVPSGFAALDACLPGGGWPQGALSELVAPLAGIGELALLMPACARLTRTGRWVIFVAPPYIPYAPALADAGLELGRLLLIRSVSGSDGLWALEQALRSRHCAAAIAWPARLDDRGMRRLQLACEQGGSSGFLFMPESAAPQASTAALRLALAPAPDGQLEIRVLKRRGGTLHRTLRIDVRSHLR